jgi:hypothetical protein
MFYEEGIVPEGAVPSGTFGTTPSWYSALALAGSVWE